MSTSVRIREYVPDDREGVLALMEKYFGAWTRQRWTQRWHWQYYGARGCCNCDSFIQVVEADGNTVGHFGAFPLPLRIGMERLEVLCPCDFVVEQEHRLGAFGLLKNLVSKSRIILGTGGTSAAHKLLSIYGARTLPLSEVRYVYQLRYRGATLRELRQRLPSSLRWMANRWSTAIATPMLDRRRGRKSKRVPRLTRNGDVRPILRFDEEYDELWRCATEQFEVSLDKNAAYLNWRYIDCPTASPLCLGYYGSNNELAGVVIAGLRVGARDERRRPWGRDGEILELIVREPDRHVVEQLLVPAMEHLNNAGVDVVAVTGLYEPLHPIMEEIGFDRTLQEWNRLFGISKMPDHPITELMRDDRWYFTAGDGDSLFDDVF